MNPQVLDLKTEELFTQLFPYPVATEKSGDAHRALTNVLVPIQTGQDINGVYRSLQIRLKKFVEFVYSDKRRGYENAIESNQTAIYDLAFALKHYDLALKGYPGRLKLDFLQWYKTETQYPAFMTMDLQSPSFSITAHKQSASFMMIPKTTLSFTPNLPEEVKEEYQVFIPTLASMIRVGEKVTIAAKFGGSPPADIDEVIDKALDSRQFNQILIFAEAPEVWDTRKEVLVKEDPIVAAVAPVYHPVSDANGFPVQIGNIITYLGIFDPSPVELLALQSCLRSIHNQ